MEDEKYYQKRVKIIYNIIQVQCDICHKSYANIYILKSHIRAIHEKAAQFKCLYPGCQKEFKSLYRLYVHDLSHEGIKPFKCNICNKAFSEKGTLKTHKKTHLNQCLFNCNFCEFKCAKSCDLAIHYKEVHKLKK